MNDVTIKGGYDRLEALGVERLTAVRNALEAGKATAQVARMIQEEFGAFKDVKTATLAQQLRRYASRYVEPKQPDVRALSNPYEGKLDTLECMEKLAAIQRHRLELVYTKEKTAQMLMSSTQKEVRELATLYKEIQQLRFELGLDVLHAAPGQQGSKMGMRVTTPDGTSVEMVSQQGLDNASHNALTVLDRYKQNIVSEQ